MPYPAKPKRAPKPGYAWIKDASITTGAHKGWRQEKLPDRELYGGRGKYAPRTVTVKRKGKNKQVGTDTGTGGSADIIKQIQNQAQGGGSTTEPTGPALGYDQGEDTSARGGYYFVPGQTEEPANAGFGVMTYQNAAKLAAIHGQRQAWQPLATPARYVEGDQDLILGDLFTSDYYLEVQAALKDRGFIGSRTDYSPGAIDDATTKGFTKLLGQANHQGVSWQDLLFGDQGANAASDSSGGSSGGGGGGGGGASGPVIDPEAVRQAVDAAGQDIIGANLSPADREAVTAQIVAGATNAPGAYDVSAQIARAIRERNPGQAATTDYTGAINNFFSMLGAGGIYGQQTQPNVATGAFGGP